MLRSAVAVVFCLAIVSCADIGGSRRVDASDTEHVIELARGGDLVVDLPESRHGESGWKLVQTAPDVLRLDGSGESPSAPSEASDTWRFVVRGSGAGVLRFERAPAPDGRSSAPTSLRFIVMVP